MWKFLQIQDFPQVYKYSRLAVLKESFFSCFTKAMWRGHLSTRTLLVLTVLQSTHHQIWQTAVVSIVQCFQPNSLGRSEQAWTYYHVGISESCCYERWAERWQLHKDKKKKQPVECNFQKSQYPKHNCIKEQLTEKLPPRTVFLKMISTYSTKRKLICVSTKYWQHVPYKKLRKTIRIELEMGSVKI